MLWASEAGDGLVGKGLAAVVSVRSTMPAPAAFEKFELASDLRAEYQSPFDSADVAMEGHFVTPAGREHGSPASCGLKVDKDFADTDWYNVNQGEPLGTIPPIRAGTACRSARG